MKVLLAELLLARTRLRRRARWGRARLEAFQQSRLAELRHHARRRSPFFADFYRGLHDAPLNALPPLTKHTLMQQWEDVVTDRGLHLDSVLRHLDSLESASADPGRPWRGRWWMAATGGTSGERGVFVWDRWEWLSILSSYARVNDWAGVRVGLGHRLPTAIVSTRHPAHQSAVVGASLQSGLVPTLRLEASEALPELVEQLNRFRPRLLVCYASMLAPLAEAQMAGTLHIAPEKVITASEEQLPEARKAAVTAWGVEVLDTYAATETATIASMCPWGAMHVYEDFVILEPVDNSYTAVEAGQMADRLLVTVLFSRTLPLIRYELTDSVRLARTPCACGSPFRVLESVAGRTESSLTMAAHGGGTVLVRPNVFHDAIGPRAVRGWQVRQTSGGLIVRVVDPDLRLDAVELVRVIRAALGAAGVTSAVSVEVDRVAALEHTRLGKTPLISQERTTEA